MPDKTPEVSAADKARLDSVDELVFRQAQAEREQQLELRRSDNKRLVNLEEIRVRDRENRRQRRGYILIGLAIVVVILGIVAAIWTGVDRAGARQVREQQQHEQTAQECIRSGNIWINDSCLLANHPAGAPAPAAS